MKGLFSKHKKAKTTSPSEAFSTFLEQNARYWCMSNDIILYPHPKRIGKDIHIKIEVKVKNKRYFSPGTYTNGELGEAMSRLYLHLFNKYGRSFFDNSVEHRLLKTEDLYV